MAERLDVAGRLGEGEPAVEHTQAYVRACEVLGYHDPELTSRPRQIRDWYDSEEGLDLRALDGDCARLRAAAGAVMEALRMQRAQVDELAAAWTGPGAESAVAFLQRHCDAAGAVATEMRAAAQRCESLRDNLWHLVDVKVATAVAIDDRTLANRPAWLAAAAAVTSGTGDRTADELVQRRVKPYVDNDIRAEWVTAMRSARAGVATSYDMVIDKFTAAAPVYFEIPEELRPGRAPFQATPASAPAVTATLAPAAAVPTLAPDPAPAGISGVPATPASLTATPPASDPGTGLGDAAALPAGLGSAAGLDGFGGLGGLSGLANRIVDELSGLLGSAGEQRNDPPGLDDALDPDDPDDHDDPAELADDDEQSDAEPEKPEEIQSVEAERARPGDPPPPIAPPIDVPPPAAVTPVGAPPPVVAPPPVAAPPSDGKTPCEIAADELPKAGQ
jgi:hypothetical protein